jgi:hypothetical protein
MNKIMASANTHTDAFFCTEATVSSCVAMEAMQNEGFSGVVCIAPFACLPGRLIKALLSPLMRKNGFPFIPLENDGFTYPPALISRLEVFMLGVLRYREEQKQLSQDENPSADEKAEQSAASGRKLIPVR